MAWFSYLSFAFLLILAPRQGMAQPLCAQVFVNEGQFSDATAMAQLISLQDLPYTPRDWTPLGFKEVNLHDSFLIPRDNITAVVKFGERVFEREPLGYQIASLLNIKMPLTISIKMGDQIGMAQVYRPHTKTLADVGRDIDINAAIRTFDRLTLNSDRHRENVLVEIAEVWAWKKEQTPIDHELIFNPGDKKVDEMLRRGPNGFLLETMPQLKKEFPEVHQAFLDPQVVAKITALIETAKGISDREVDYVKSFFKAYRNIAKLYESEETRRR